MFGHTCSQRMLLWQKTLFTKAVYVATNLLTDVVFCGGHSVQPILGGETGEADGDTKWIPHSFLSPAH